MAAILFKPECLNSYMHEWTLSALIQVMALRHTSADLLSTRPSKSNFSEFFIKMKQF